MSMRTRDRHSDDRNQQNNPISFITHFLYWLANLLIGITFLHLQVFSAG